MIVIRAVCSVHALWGLGFIFGDREDIAAARPIGSIEPFLQYLTPTQFGCLLIGVSVIPFLVAQFGGQRRHGLAVPIAVIPQQLVLFWGIFWAMIWFAQGIGTFRTYIGLSWQGALAFWHAVEIYRLIRQHLIEQRIKAQGRHNAFR